ncbi:MFS transporter [Lysinibacillus sp. NPDC096418]|uniref:MFS transporter n=1 Tax=Lysinibacillus sp. NPDC096418 TaxID=3364138 RepID=UPI00381F3895
MTHGKIQLLSSMLIANIGEWVYFIALNLIVLELTDSPFAVSILYLLIPIAILITNSWAGTFIDRMNVKRLLIALDILRASLVLVLVFTTNIFLIYSFSLVIHMCVAIYSNASFVYMTKFIDKAEQQRFNAWKNVVQSSGFILGPSIAGGLFFIGSPQLAILINSVALVFSALLLFGLPDVKIMQKQGEIVSIDVVKNDWRVVFSFARKAYIFSLVYILNSIFIVFMTVLDSLEASFAIRSLNFSESEYGLLVSIAGIGFILGSLFNTKWQFRPIYCLKYGAVMTTVGYLIFGISNEWWMASCGFFIISFANAFVNIGFLTYIQQVLPTDILGRFSSIFALIEASCSIIFILLFGLLTNLLSIRIIILFGVAMLFVIVIAIFFVFNNDN